MTTKQYLPLDLETISAVFGRELTSQHQDKLKSSELPSQSTEDQNLDTDGPSTPKTPRIQSEIWQSVVAHINTSLKNVTPANVGEVQEGRIGPKVVKYDIGNETGTHGTFVISNDRLGLNSQCNFGSVRACVCVFKGKWQYEVQLGSNGVMQLGWATLDTKFSQEKGVGDSIDSYAYDGNRLRKWNKTTSKYGEQWQTGDIIGCCIDLEEGKVEFLRNGRSLGVAFRDVRRGPSIAYFPAVSLAYQESIIANFGATPLQYPLEGYFPLQYEQSSDNEKCEHLLQWLGKSVALQSNMTTLLINNKLIELLGPHFGSGYIIHRSFLPFFKRTFETSSVLGKINYDQTNKLLDILWGFLEAHELQSLMEKVVGVLLNQFTSNGGDTYALQEDSLNSIIALIQHDKTRRFVIDHLLFDKGSTLFKFLYIRPMDEKLLKDVLNLSDGCEKISSQVNDLTLLQIRMMKVLLTNTDGTDKLPSSRALLLKKLRTFIRDVVRPNTLLHSPVQKAMSTFYIILQTCSELYKEVATDAMLPSLPPSLFYDTSLCYFEIERIGGLISHLYKVHHALVAEKLSIPDYYNENPDPSGSSVHTTPSNATRTTADERSTGPGQNRIVVSSGAGTSVTITMPRRFGPNGGSVIPAAVVTGSPSGHNMFIPMFMEFRHSRHGPSYVEPSNPAITLLGKDFGQMDKIYSLRELLDDAILIFNAGVSANIEKIASFMKYKAHYEEAIRTAQSALAEAEQDSLRFQELQRSIEIFEEKLDEQNRRYLWIKAAVYTKARCDLSYALLKTILKTLQLSSQEGDLFQFVPDHYVTTLINLTWLILKHFQSVMDLSEIHDLKGVLIEVAEFVAIHFSDPRIVVAETKDSLSQALSMFIGNETMLSCLESMAVESRQKLVKGLLRPYENRAWAQSNWMLVRIWQGDGFGFQYPSSQEARKSCRIKPIQEEYGIDMCLAPNPSRVLQQHVAEVLLDDQKFAVTFIHSILNQLNWAFSEFVGLLQEIQSGANRPERVFVETRQLKICSTCFELTQALLRVLEMVVSVAGPVLTDFNRESAEALLGRLAMLLSQILNRAGSSPGTFASVVELDIPGLESVTYFPLLGAVAGVLCQLVRPELDATDRAMLNCTAALLNEPSFQIRSLDFARNEETQKFSLANFVPVDITPSELELFNKIVDHLTSWSDKIHGDQEAIDDDTVCTICYAYKQNCIIKPCGHKTCKSCILHHLMNRGDCFFCKSAIQEVLTDEGNVIYKAAPSK